GGWPPRFQETVLRSAHAKAISGRPGAALPAADFIVAKDAIRAMSRREPRDEDVLSYLLYPQVFEDYQKHWQLYENTSPIPTANFFYGMQPGEETAVDIERGKTLIIRYLTTGDVREDGTRTVFYELNGQPREVTVVDKSITGTVKRHPKADPDDTS